MSFRKFLKKAGKVIKKAAPLAKLAGAAGLATLIPGGGAVLGAMKLASKLKSAGKAARDVVKPQAPPNVEAPHITALVNRYSIPTVQPRPIATPTFRAARAPASPRVAAAAPRRRKARAPSKATLAALYDQFIADGRPGDWQDYARSQLGS
jgi:hypothetical protein